MQLEQFKTINIAAGTTGTTVERWAIMLAQENQTEQTKTYGDIIVRQEAIGKIKENDFKKDGIAVVLNPVQ